MRNIRQVLVVLVAISVIVLLFVLISKGFRSNSTPVKQTDLVSYASTNAVAELYIDGPIVLDQNHHTIKISVDQNQSQIQIMQGYQRNIVDSRSYPNNTAGYAVFLQALKNLNFTKGNSSAALRDERGYCPAGNRYIYQFESGGDTLFRYWSTSCGQGTFSGNRQQVRSLFQGQIPHQDFSKLVSGLSL